jgi:MtrB/PioB family decaheme-associated outer membrane protein
MRATTSIVMILALAGPALADEVSPASPPPVAPQAAVAQTPRVPPPRVDTFSATPMPEPYKLWQVDLGFQYSDSDTASSKFLEYREYHYATSPFLRFMGGDTLRYDFAAWNVGQDNGRYLGLLEQGSVSMKAELSLMPHRFGSDSRSLFADDGRGNFTIADDVQLANQQRIEQQRRASAAGVNFSFLNALVRPQIAATSPFDVQLRRDRGGVDVNFTKDKPVAVRLSYLHEERNGSRGSGTAFGFGNVVETAEPIDYRTQDIGLSAEWTPSWGLIHGGVHLNEFTNFIPVQTFDNPFRATDSTDASAYQAPASASIAGASFARMALPPDNRAITGNVGMSAKFGGKHRFSATASYGRWTQDTAFIPFTTNTAIRTPFDATSLSNLPAPSLDGRIDVLSLTSTLYLRPTRNTNVTARYRRYDLDNKTPRIEFPEGYTRYDGVWEDIPRISVPYGYTNDQGQVSGSVTLNGLTFEAGYKLDRWARTFRESEDTLQQTGFVALQDKPLDWITLRASYERGKRTFGELDSGHEDYDPEHAEHHSFLDPGPAANLTLLRRYDQAEKQIDRLTSMVQLSPGGSTTIALSYVWGNDDYTRTEFGLVSSENKAFSAEVDFTPTERLSLFGFYTREDIDSFQRGRQSAATPSVNPLDNWTAAMTDDVDTFGVGADFVLKPETLDLRLNGTFQNVDGNAAILAPLGGAPANARTALGGVAGLPIFDDTKLLTLSAELGYRLKNGWRVAVGGLFEDYELQDPFAVGSTVYTPGGMFLAGNDGDYRGHVIYTRLTKRW